MTKFKTIYTLPDTVLYKKFPHSVTVGPTSMKIERIVDDIVIRRHNKYQMCTASGLGIVIKNTHSQKSWITHDK